MNTSAIQADTSSPANKPGIRVLPLLLRRLRSTRPSTLFFYLFGTLIMSVWLTPRSLPAYGWKILILSDIIPLVLIGLTMLVVQQLSAEGGSGMVRRPAWFLFVMATATALSYGAIWLYDKAMSLGIFDSFWVHPFFPAYYRFSIVFIPIGWLSCLYLQQDEDEAKFATLSIRRAILSREVAQSQLLTARAQIDPGLVERVLSEIQALYQTDADSAAQLMDHLISYLRLAMNRGRETHPKFPTEIALVRSYLSLRKSEIGMEVNLRTSSAAASALSEASSFPIFLSSRKMVDALVSDGLHRFSMQIDALGDSVLFTLHVKGNPLSEAGLERLRKNLTEIPLRTADMLHRIPAPDEHIYTIEIHSSHEPADSTDR